MYTVNNEAVAGRIESYCRTWRMWLECTNGIDPIIMGDEIMSATGSVSSTSLSDDIELGAVCAQSWNMTIYGENEFLGKEYDLYFYLVDFEKYTTYADLEQYTCGELEKMTAEQIEHLGEILSGEKIPLGKFTCVKSKKNGGSVEVTMADKLYFSDRIYKPQISLPAWSRDVEDDICAQLGLENGNDYISSAKLRVKTNIRLYDKNHLRLKTANFDFKIASIPENTTMRQMLSYIASAQGEFGFVDRYGRYVRKWYGRTEKILDNNTIDLPTLSERQNVITGISCKVSDSRTIKLGNSTGRMLEFENPYMTVSLLNSLWYRIKGFSWYTTELYHRLGDPRFDVGDVVTYDSGEQTYDIPITNISFTYDGGLAADISAAGLSVEEQIDTGA